MNRKLVALNIVLAVAVVYAAIELRKAWLAAREREAKEFQHRAAAQAVVPPFQAMAPVTPLMATSYERVAQEFLFDPSRNPKVPIPEKPAPPPPEPPPPLPLWHGIMNVGNGPQLIMSANANSKRKWISAGDMIGDYKVLAFSAEEVDLQWKDQVTRKRLEDLAGHGAGLAHDDSDEVNPHVTPATRVLPTPQPLGPGPEGANGQHACQDNDTMAVGTVINGLVKTEIKNPLLGSVNCIWVPQNR